MRCCVSKKATSFAYYLKKKTKTLNIFSWVNKWNNIPTFVSNCFLYKCITCLINTIYGNKIYWLIYARKRNIAFIYVKSFRYKILSQVEIKKTRQEKEKRVIINKIMEFKQIWWKTHVGDKILCDLTHDIHGETGIYDIVKQHKL